jgi:replication fork protection complex subunit Csm3/Swi3
MLNMYQLWLDDLYPRAKFADALAIIEKVGHTKRMQVDRKAWIDEGKPGRKNMEGNTDDLDAAVPDEAPAENQREETEGMGANDGSAWVSAQSSLPKGLQDQAQAEAEEPDEDELDALLAETAQPETPTANTLPSRPAPAEDDLFADEMEAMEGMDDMW